MWDPVTAALRGHEEVSSMRTYAGKARTQRRTFTIPSRSGWPPPRRLGARGCTFTDTDRWRDWSANGAPHSHHPNSFGVAAAAPSSRARMHFHENKSLAFLRLFQRSREAILCTFEKRGTDPGFAPITCGFQTKRSNHWAKRPFLRRVQNSARHNRRPRFWRDRRQFSGD